MPKRLLLRRFRRGEKQKLMTKLRDRKLPVWAAHRYLLIGLMRGGLSTLAAARRIGCAKETAYRCLTDFNRSGFRHFERSSNPAGRPSGITRQQVQDLVRIARKRPTDVGLPFTNWSMTKLQDYLLKHQLFPSVSPEWLRRLLHRADVSWQHTKTWKHSDDPDFKAKKSGFSNCMPVVPSMAPSFATTSSALWNFARWLACAGPASENHSGTERPINATKAPSNCTHSMMSMPTAWLGECANERPRRILWAVLPSCEHVIPCKCASISSWTTCRPTFAPPTISSQATTWRPFTCPPMLLGSTQSSVNSRRCMRRHLRTQTIPIILPAGGGSIATFVGEIGTMEAPNAISRSLCVSSLERH